jgi:hypothetical protein
MMEQTRELEVIAEAPATSSADIVRNASRDNQRKTEPIETLFPLEESSELHDRWAQIQTAFVDDPRSSVESADHLVADTIKRLAEIFAAQRSLLEQEWAKGDGVSTEDFRQAFRKYRAFFDRLLSAASEPVPSH